MFLKAILSFLAPFFLSAGAASAQGLTPIRKEGSTLSDHKGFYVTVRNPFKRPMSFDLQPMETDLATPAEKAEARPGQIRIGGSRSRSVIILFEIPQNAEERSVALCVTPNNIDSYIVTRVCGTYTARRAR